ncbi:MAG: hypothetical protein ABIK28_21765, partial [Planctomycetota bacterium]
SIFNAGRPVIDLYRYLKYIVRDGSSFTLYTVVGGVITQLQGQEYIQAYANYEAILAAPFAKMEGSTIVGAQGIWFQGIAAADANKVKVKTDLKVDLEPYKTVTIALDNTLALDRVWAYLNDGSGAFDKDTYTAASNTINASTFEISASIPIDTPSTGGVYVVDTSAQEEHRYRFASWDGAIFSFPTAITGSCSSGGSATTLKGSGFLAADIIYGDMVRNTTSGAWAYVVEVVDDNTITTSTLSSGTWASGNGYSFHTLAASYDSSDTAFVPYISTRATGTSVTQNVLYNVDRNLLIEVRQAGSLRPYTASGVLSENGFAVTVNRNPDAIFP